MRSAYDFLSIYEVVVRKCPRIHSYLVARLPLDRRHEELPTWLHYSAYVVKINYAELIESNLK